MKGRCEVEDKKKQIPIGIRQSVINKLGKKKIQEIMEKAVADAYQIVILTESVNASAQ